VQDKAVDMRGRLFGIGDMVIYRAGKGLKIANVVKFTYSVSGRIFRVGVEVDKYRPDGSMYPYHYSLDYYPSNFCLISKEDIGDKATDAGVRLP
jgi:hypothetical protein